MKADPRGSRFAGDPALCRLGRHLALLRRARGLSQVELGRRIGMSSAHISLIERGTRNPPYLTLRQIARALGRPTRELIPKG